MAEKGRAAPEHVVNVTIAFDVDHPGAVAMRENHVGANQSGVGVNARWSEPGGAFVPAGVRGLGIVHGSMLAKHVFVAPSSSLPLRLRREEPRERRQLFSRRNALGSKSIDQSAYTPICSQLVHCAPTIIQETSRESVRQ